MIRVPPTASEHPATWKHGYPIYHPANREAWRAWLEAHQASARGVWVATWRRHSGRSGVPYPDLVEEALCFGWIDSTTNVLDEARRLQLMTPRRPRSGWSRLNRERVARLTSEGRMTDAGRAAVEVAQANGSWRVYDAVEDLDEPADLAAALDQVPGARRTWDGFPPSARKNLLWWVVGAVKPDTRARRIARIVTDAAEGRRPQG